MSLAIAGRFQRSAVPYWTPRQLAVLGPESLQASTAPPGSVTLGGDAAGAAGAARAPVAAQASRHWSSTVISLV